MGTIEGVRKLRLVAAFAALFFLLGLTVLLAGCGEDTPTAEPTLAPLPTATATATATATNTPMPTATSMETSTATLVPSPTATQTPQGDAPQAPDFSLPTGSGDLVTLDQLLEGHDALVLVFYRSFF